MLLHGQTPFAVPTKKSSRFEQASRFIPTAIVEKKFATEPDGPPAGRIKHSSLAHANIHVGQPPFRP